MYLCLLANPSTVITQKIETSFREIYFEQSLCCVDKKGVLSWPNPTPEKIFLLRSHEVPCSQDIPRESEESIPEMRGKVADNQPVLKPPKIDQGTSRIFQVVYDTQTNLNPYWRD